MTGFLSPKPRLQSGALVYRVSGHNRRQVLLVRKMRSKRWGIPKGTAQPNLSLAQNAAKEVFEETGVSGIVEPNSVGMFRAVKRTPVGEQILEIWVYFLRATESTKDFPESGKRETKWVGCKQAAGMIAEPVLVDLCMQLETGVPGPDSSVADANIETRKFRHGGGKVTSRLPK
jgi:ADP-ribose pyrophosphatase YjhB (NUDIX family)